MITTKDHMLAALNNVLNSYVFGMVVSRTQPEGGWDRLASEKMTVKGPGTSVLTVELAPLVKNLANPSDRKLLLEEFENVLKRSMLSEAHEIVLAYCEASQQFALYKAQPWFQFARIIRNVTSHKDCGVLHKWPPNLAKAGITSATWRHRTLDTALVGKSITFTHYETFHLFQDITDFARTVLQ